MGNDIIQFEGGIVVPLQDIAVLCFFQPVIQIYGNLQGDRGVAGNSPEYFRIDVCFGRADTQADLLGKAAGRGVPEGRHPRSDQPDRLGHQPVDYQIHEFVQRLQRIFFHGTCSAELFDQVRRGGKILVSQFFLCRGNLIPDAAISEKRILADKG